MRLCFRLDVKRFALLSLVAMTGWIGQQRAQAQTAPDLVPTTVKLVAGGGTAAIASGGTCPTSGLIATDSYGDGCLATEVQLTQPRYAIADQAGNIFFSDYKAFLVRRVDATTGIITTVAGGASSSPASGAACDTGISTDKDGDGCPGPLVSLGAPAGLAFDAAGNLYFADEYLDNVRKIEATGGLIPATGGIISTVAGNPSDTWGYNVNNTAANPPVIAATEAYLDEPFALAFDKAGNLYIAGEGNQAIQVVNLTGADETLQGMSIPANSIAKMAGWGSNGGKTLTADCPSFIDTSSTANRGGCYFGAWADGQTANTQPLDSPYGVAVDPTGDVFVANEFNDNVGKITPGNVITTYAGGIVPSGGKATAGTTLTRGTATSFNIGSTIDVASDTGGNLYVTDALNGVVWRVDAGSQAMYPVAGGAGQTGSAYSAVCSTAVDSYGDGCSALAATFGKSGTSYAATPYSGSPGISGVTVDAYSNLFIGDSITGLVREVSSGTQFGTVGATQPTNTLDVHFAAGDGPAGTNPFVITTGSANFKLGTPSCPSTPNSDGTLDCSVPVTATPALPGPFSGVLTVTSQNGGTGTFTLTGTSTNQPASRTTISYSTGSTSCGTGSAISTTATVTLKATVVSTSTGTPTGMVQFLDNGAPLGTATLGSDGTATLTQTFAAGTHSITAIYAGDSVFTGSSSTVPASFTTAASSFGVAALSTQSSSVTAGGTALYSFTATGNGYTGNISFFCSGLPAGASCQFSPQTIVGTGCATSSTVAMSIFTSQSLPIQPGSLSGSGRGPWSLTALFAGFVLALGIGLSRRRLGKSFGTLGMTVAFLLMSSGLLACSSNTTPKGGTPAGTYTVTVTAVGTPASDAPTGGSQTFTVPLTIQ